MSAPASQRGSLSFGDKAAVLLMLWVACDAAYVAIPRELQKREAAKRERARLELAALKQALDTYYVKNGRYPADWRAVVDAGILASVPNDPWGHPYEYEFLGGAGHLASFGRDGAPGGEGADADLIADEPMESVQR